MNEDDLALRNLTYARFVELGRAPTAGELAAVAGREPAEIQAGWERLLVLGCGPQAGVRGMVSCVPGAVPPWADRRRSLAP